MELARIKEDNERIKDKEEELTFYKKNILENEDTLKKLKEDT